MDDDDDRGDDDCDDEQIFFASWKKWGDFWVVNPTSTGTEERTVEGGVQRRDEENEKSSMQLMEMWRKSKDQEEERSRRERANSWNENRFIQKPLTAWLLESSCQ